MSHAYCLLWESNSSQGFGLQEPPQFFLNRPLWKMSEYTTAFTAGALMPDKTVLIMEEVRRGTMLDEVYWDVLVEKTG